MAQRVVVTLSDDLDGGAAEETVQFGLDGKSYEIDLSAENAEKLRSALAPYVQAGRKQARAAALKAHPRRTEIAPDPARSAPGHSRGESTCRPAVGCRSTSTRPSPRRAERASRISADEFARLSGQYGHTAPPW
jgi:hypothetical protein